uniref:prepilin-type N-terminal cleavage/methylation domain-containing protein n=1 Tax=Gemmiger formicilis TaxID=745368 RepID=UPI003FEDD086
MFEKIRKMKNKKGFTLVELIVVLVILAILAALLIPALTGYIDKANKEKVVAECRMVVMAAQTEASEAYGKLTSKSATSTTDAEKLAAQMTTDIEDLKKLAEVGGTFKVTVAGDATIKEVVYSHSGFNCTYSDGAYNVVKQDDKVTAVVGYTVVKAS